MDPDSPDGTGTVSESVDEPQCSIDGCTNSVVPGQPTCGDEDHAQIESVNHAADGTVVGAVDVSGGLTDGTGRSATTIKEFHSVSKIPDTADERRAASLSFGDQQSNVYNALLDFLSAAGGFPDIWIIDLGPDWVVWEAWGSDRSFYQMSYTAADDGTVSFKGTPQEVTITVKTTYDPVSRDDAAIDALRSVIETFEDSAGASESAGVSLMRDSFIKQAEELNASDLIPETWRAAEEDDAEATVEETEEETPEPVEETEPRAAARGGKKWKPRKRSAPAPSEEFRLRVSDLEIRDDSSDSEIVLTGTPIVYNSAYDVHDMFGTFRETMAPEVCDHVLSSPANLDCRYLFNHDGLPLARTQSQTLELVNERGGLRAIAHLDSRQQLANDLAVAVERGDVSQMSCGFIVADDEWDDDYMNRTIRSFAQLLDVSPVTYPASPTTTVSLSQRALFALPTESRARIREAFKVANELRAGKQLSTANAQLIMSALESLHAADDLDPDDVAQRAGEIAQAHANARQQLEQVSGLALDPAATSDGDSVVENDPDIRDDEPTDEEIRAAELRRKRILAKRESLARRRHRF